MHRFYVQEGNKRVSVLKFLDAPTVTAKVTRLYPGTWDSVESRLYGEFCVFWYVCPLYEIEFSREGGYETLAKMFGQDLVEKWPQKKVDYLRHTFLLFKRAYLRAGGDHLDITPTKSTSSVLNFFMGKTVYSAANPLRIAFIHEFPCATSSWDSLHDQERQYLDEAMCRESVSVMTGMAI